MHSEFDVIKREAPTQVNCPLIYYWNMYIGSRSISGNREIAGSSHLLHITQNKQMKGKNKMQNANRVYQRIECKYCKARLQTSIPNIDYHCSLRYQTSYGPVL